MEIIVILIALFFTISSLVISYMVPQLQVLVLTILTLILPATYQIGHLISREIVRGKNEMDFSEAQDMLEELEDENVYLKEILGENRIPFEEEVLTSQKV